MPELRSKRWLHGQGGPCAIAPHTRLMALRLLHNTGRRQPARPPGGRLLLAHDLWMISEQKLANCCSDGEHQPAVLPGWPCYLTSTACRNPTPRYGWRVGWSVGPMAPRTWRTRATALYGSRNSDAPALAGSILRGEGWEACAGPPPRDLVIRVPGRQPQHRPCAGLAACS